MEQHGWALGMIETVGFPALVAAGDAAAKAADVRVVTYQGADAGIVTLYLVGDVASVQAAVAAGKEAAKQIGQLRAAHVIPRPGPRVGQLVNRLTRESQRNDRLAGANHPPPQPSPPAADSARAGEAGATAPPPAGPEEQSGGTSTDSGETAKQPAEAADQPDVERPGSDLDLMKASVAQLRKLARSRKDFPLSSAEISLARKEELVRLLSRLGKERSEEEA